MMTLTDIAAIAQSLFAAYDTGLLRALLERTASAAEFADGLSLDPTSTRLILDVLTGAGFARHDGDGYCASDSLRETIMRSPVALDGVLALWRQIPEFLRSGTRFRRMDGPAAERAAEYKDVVLGLATLFTPSAQVLARTLGGTPRRILDVGAGSGIWSLAIAQAHPEATVTALDFPDVLASFQRQAASMGLGERIALLAGDMYSLDVADERYDVIVLANILHLEPAERAAVLLHRVAEALAPGGRIVVVDVFGGESAAAELGRAIYSLHLSMRTERGVAHPLSDVQTWLEGAGMQRAMLIEFDDPLVRGLGAVVAERAAHAGDMPAHAQTFVHA